MDLPSFDVTRCMANARKTIELAGATVMSDVGQLWFEQDGQNFALDIVPFGETACISVIATNLTSLDGNDQAALDYVYSFFSRRYQLVKAVVTHEHVLNASFQSLACDERYYTPAVHEFAVQTLLNAKQDFFACLS